MVSGEVVDLFKLSEGLFDSFGERLLAVVGLPPIDGDVEGE
ncbi:MAG: hypothetical protein ACJAR2_002904 [Ilumatobacter sp.]|jgi:hypothetical protein